MTFLDAPGSTDIAVVVDPRLPRGVVVFLGAPQAGEPQVDDSSPGVHRFCIPVKFQACVFRFAPYESDDDCYASGDCWG